MRAFNMRIASSQVDGTEVPRTMGSQARRAGDAYDIV